MAQLSEQSSDLLNTMRSQGAGLVELTRTVGRGVPALRDASDNVLELNPNSRTPLLVSNVNDVGITFNPYQLAVVDRTGQDYRGIQAESFGTADYSAALNSNGEVWGKSFTGGETVFAPDVYGTRVHGSSLVEAPDVYADRVHIFGANGTVMDNAGVSTAGHYVGKDYYAGLGFYAGTAGHNQTAFFVGNTLMDKDGFAAGHIFVTNCYVSNEFILGNSSIHVNGMHTPQFSADGIVVGTRTFMNNSGVFADGFFLNGSEARLKQDITPTEDAHLATVIDAPIYDWRYRADMLATPAAAAADTAAAATTDTSDVTDPDVEPWRFGPLADDLPDRVLGDGPNGKAPDLVAMVFTAWGAIQELSAKLDTATEQIAELSARLDAIDTPKG